MILLPVGHEDTVVRRVPWISVGILVACVGSQVHSCAVTPALEKRGASIMNEMEQLTEAAVRTRYEARWAAARRARDEAARRGDDMDQAPAWQFGSRDDVETRAPLHRSLLHQHAARRVGTIALSRLVWRVRRPAQGAALRTREGGIDRFKSIIGRCHARRSESSRSVWPSLQS